MSSIATATIRISGLAKQKLNVLRAQAQEAGISAELYAKRLIEEGILLEQQARTKTFDELYASAQERFRSSGMNEDQLDQLVDAARTRHNRRSAKKRG
jgi:hypothetical protein